MNVTQTLGLYLPEETDIYSVSHFNDNMQVLDTQIKDLQDSLSTDVLWENASPNSNFPAQKISLDWTEYDLLEIVFSNSAANMRMSTKPLSTGEFRKGMSLWGNYGVSPAMEQHAMRRFSLTEDGIQAEDCCLFTRTDSNYEIEAHTGLLKPLMICGIKGGAV